MKKLKHIIYISFIVVSLISPMVTVAQNDGVTVGADGGAGNNPTTSTTTTTTVYEGASLQNPLAGGDINDIPTLVEKLLGIVLVVGVPLIALAIIYAGFKFVTAQGNSTKLEEAKKTFVWIIVGAAILLSAYAIAQGIKATITDIRGN